MMTMKLSLFALFLSQVGAAAAAIKVRNVSCSRRQTAERTDRLKYSLLVSL